MEREDLIQEDMIQLKAEIANQFDEISDRIIGIEEKGGVSLNPLSSFSRTFSTRSEKVNHHQLNL